MIQHGVHKHGVMSLTLNLSRFNEDQLRRLRALLEESGQREALARLDSKTDGEERKDKENAPPPEGPVVVFVDQLSPIKEEM